MISWTLTFLAVMMSACPLKAGASLDWPAIEREATTMLQEYIKIDTSNPPGDVSKAVDFLEEILRQEGISSRRYVADESRGRINLLARLPGKGHGKPLLMLAHMDVVPVDASRWLLPPFSGVIRDGELWGRGAVDMKGQGVIELMAMLLLKRQGFVPSRDLLLLFNGDEETGGELGAGWMVEHHYADLDPEFVLDEGAAGSRGIYTDDDRVVFGVSVQEKKVLWLKITAVGDSGRGSMPGPRNAVEKLTRVLVRIPELRPPARDTAMVADMKRRLGKFASNPITRAMERTTITVTTLTAGVGRPPKVNVIPGKAEATVDCRLLPEDSVADMIAKIEALLDDPDVTLEVLHRPSPVKPLPHDSPLFQAIISSVAAYVPEAVTVPVLLTGGTDARYFRSRGVKAYGFEPMIRTVEEEKLLHSNNERIRLSEFYRGLRIYHHLLRSFLK